MVKTKNGRKALALIGILGVFVTAADSSVAADTAWQKNRPRREQVNNRLANQNKHIKDEVKEGDMSKAQARKIHRDDRMIRQKERAMGRKNGGHIATQE